MKSDSKLPLRFVKSTPWENREDSIWLGSSLVLHRNIYPFFFPDLLSEADAKHTLTLIEKHLFPLLESAQMLTQTDLIPHDKEYLFEHFILSEGYEKFDQRKALLIDEGAGILGLLNVEDHLHLHFFSKEENLEQLFKKSSMIERHLSQVIPFSFSDKFGYLTSDPLLCGTGLVVSAFLHLPALIALKKSTELFESLGPGISIRGLGKENEYIGDLVLIENKYKIGLSEEAIIETVTDAAKKLVQAELLARKNLENEEIESLKNLIARAYGLLTTAYQLDTGEALRNISLLELAKTLGLCKTSPSFSFKNLFFTTRRAHLLQKEGLLTATREEVMKMRANLIKGALGNSQLLLS